MTANMPDEGEFPQVPESPDNLDPKERGTDAFIAFAEEQLEDISVPWQWHAYQFAWFLVGTGAVTLVAIIIGAAIVMMGGTP